MENADLDMNLYEQAIWEALRSLSDVKIETDKGNGVKVDLMELQRKLMETQKWIDEEIDCG